MTAPLLTLLNPHDLAAYTAAGYWGSETLYAIAARHARATPDAFAVRARHRRLTYRVLGRARDRAAGQPRSQPGDVSAVHLGHDRDTERRAAQRQHAAGHGADDGARLASGAPGALHAEPAQPQSWPRCIGDGAGGGRRAG